MKPHKILQPWILQCFVAIAICMISFPSTSMSRMGTAAITDSEGIPCFSIPDDVETSRGLPLQGISVSELPDGRSELPHNVWRLKATNYNSLPTLHPKKCIQYGENPDGTEHYRLKPLELLKVYSVFINAKHRGSSMMGYSGEFCLKPAGAGRTTVQVISEDQSLGDARFAECFK